MLKAKSGGGGRGHQGVNTFQELLKVFPEASLEAQNSFGDGQLFLESYIANPVISKSNSLPIVLKTS